MANLVAGRRSSHLLASASFAVIVLATAVPAQGQTWDGSDSGDPLDNANWVGGVAPISGGNIIITGPATHMPIIDGLNLTLGTAFVGHDANLGGAQVSIINGANLTTTSASIGEPSVNNAGDLLELDSAVATMSGASTWTSTFLYAGSYGRGTINVTDGSTLTASQTILLGLHRGATTLRFGTGTLNVSGIGSQVNSTGATIVGADGVGAVSVTGGGRLTTNATTLGQHTLGIGTVTVDGANSVWTVGAATTNIGQNGSGRVDVTNGGVLNSSGMIVLGADAGTGTLTVSGATSAIRATQIRIGGEGSGIDGTGTLTAEAGALVQVTNLILGGTATGVGTANFSGPNTSVNASSYAMVGWGGQGTLTLKDAATLQTPLVVVGFSAGSSGTLNIGAEAVNAATAAGTLNAAEVRFGSGSGTLVFNHTDTNLVFAPKLAGNGTVRHLAGNTTLTGNSATFTGTTRIEGGLLRVTQTLPGAMTVMTGGTLGGSGTVGTTQIDSGGAIAPDGTLNVAGNLSFANGSLYRVDTGGGATDLIAATGSVAINGGNVVVQAPTGPFNWQQDHRILGAGTALTGTFGGVSSQMVFLDSALDYSRPNEVWLGFNRNSTTFASVGATPNQQSVGQALGGLPDTNAVVSAMSVMTADQARDALDQLAGDTHSTLQGVNGALSNQVQDMVANRVRQSFNTVDTDDAASSYLAMDDASFREQVPTFWLQGLGEHTRVDANGGAGGLSIGSAGLIGGADMLLLDDWRVGIAGGYARSSFSAIDRPASGTSDNLYAGIYAGARFDAVRLQLSAQHIWHGLSTRRDVAFGGFTDTLAADYWAQTTQVHGELGYVLDLGAVEIEPFGSLSYALTNTPAFTETGGVAALSSAAAQSDAAVTVLGTRLEAPFALENMLVTVRGMVGWQYQHGQAATSQFTLAGSQPFTVAAASLAGHALVYEAGLNMDVTEGLNLDVVYAGRLSSHDVSHSIKGIVGARF